MPRRKAARPPTLVGIAAGRCALRWTGGGSELLRRPDGPPRPGGHCGPDGRAGPADRVDGPGPRRGRRDGPAHPGHRHRGSQLRAVSGAAGLAGAGRAHGGHGGPDRAGRRIPGGDHGRDGRRAGRRGMAPVHGGPRGRGGRGRRTGGPGAVAARRRAVVCLVAGAGGRRLRRPAGLGRVTCRPAERCSPRCGNGPNGPRPSRTAGSPRPGSRRRTRIAGEMHDVLAHRLSLVATYAGALEYRPDSSPQQIWPRPPAWSGTACTRP